MTDERSEEQRLPPQNLIAERALLGSLLRDNVCIGDVIPLVREDDFYVAANRFVYGAIFSLYDAGKPADLVTVADLLKLRGQTQEATYGYLGDLWDAVATAANAEHYATIVAEHGTLRRLIHAATEILKNAYDRAGPAVRLIEEAEQAILGLSQIGALGTTVELRKAIGEVFDRIDARCNDAASMSGIPTGFVDLDTKTAGLQNSELIVLAARPSVGKTALALGIMRNMLLGQKMQIFFASLEQSRVEVAERLLCCQGQVDGQKLRRGMVSDEAIDRLTEAKEILLGDGTLHIDDSPHQTVSRIAANARRLKARCGIGAVFVDYLQLIGQDKSRNRGQNRQEEVAETSRRLKLLARELKVPVVVLAQLNREVEYRSAGQNGEDGGRKKGRPRLADLRDSGAIEQDADTVLLLHREEGSPGTIEVIIAKQRNGPTGDLTLAFLKPFTRFENFAVTI
jgi:replicative DNA helicase